MLHRVTLKAVAILGAVVLFLLSLGNGLPLEANQATSDFGAVGGDRSGYTDLLSVDVKRSCSWYPYYGVECVSYTLDYYNGLIETFSEYLHYLWSRGALDARSRWYNIMGYDPQSHDAGFLTTYNKDHFTASSYYTFAPDSIMTREQFFAILAKAFGLAPNSTESPYSDYRNSEYATRNYAEWFANYSDDLVELTWKTDNTAHVRILALIDGAARPFWRAIYIGNNVPRGTYTLSLPAKTKAVEVIHCCISGRPYITSIRRGNGGIINFPDYQRTTYYSTQDQTYYPWVRAAMIAGWATGDSNGRFYPQQPIKKIDVVLPLIMAMGYERIANSMPPSEIDMILGRFSDANTIPAGLREEVALLVKRQILLYETKSNPPKLNLEKQLTRTEGATMIALALMHRHENTFVSMAIPHKATTGQSIAIVAFPPKGASEVVANVPTGTDSWEPFSLERAVILPINDEGLEQWNSIWVVPQNLSGGQYSISLVANYPDGKARQAAVDIEVVEGSPTTIDFNDVCALLSDPAWAEPGKSVLLGCQKPASSSYVIDSGSVTIDNVGTYQLNRGGDDVWYTQITVPNKESLYRVVYSLSVRSQDNGQTRSVTGEQTLIVAASVGYCPPPVGLDTSLSPGYGKVRLFR